jgi:simple sugar transport system permease protein
VISLRVQPRLAPSAWHLAAAWVGALTCALGVGALLLTAAGVPPLAAYAEMLAEAFATRYGFSETLVKATPLLLCGLGLGLAFRICFWNIGAEGQLYLGAAAATAAAAWPLPVETAWLRLPCMAVAAFLAGAGWGLVPALLKLGRQVNEIVSSLLLNYVAIALVGYLVYGPWKDPASSNFPMTAVVPPSARLPRYGDLRVNAGLAVALAALALVYVLQERSRLGFAARVIGSNPTAARYAGVEVARTMLVAVMLSGGLAGLAGMVEVAGLQHRLIPALSPGYGYTAIIVAWLGRLHPAGIGLAAVLLGGLFSGGEVLQIVRQVPVSVVFMFQGLLLLAFLAGDLFTRYRVTWRPPSTRPVPAPMETAREATVPPER